MGHGDAWSLRGVRCLVLGASGFIGRWVARALTSAEADLYVVTRVPGAADVDRWGIRAREVHADLVVPGDLEALVTTTQPDVVFNLAGYGVDRTQRDATLAQALNEVLPARLAAACQALPASPWPGLRLVHAGSALEYGTTGGVLHEDSPAQPTTVYGQTKLAGTHAVTRASQRSGLKAVTARLFTVIGPGEHAGRLFPTLVAASRRDGPVALSAGHQRRDFAFAGDVAEALLRLAATTCARPGEVVNVASGAMFAVREFALVAAALLGMAPARLAFGAIEGLSEEMAPRGVAVDRYVELTDDRLPDRLEDIVSRATAAVRQLRWDPPSSGA